MRTIQVHIKFDNGQTITYDVTARDTAEAISQASLAMQREYSKVSLGACIFETEEDFV